MKKEKLNVMYIRICQGVSVHPHLTAIMTPTTPPNFFVLCAELIECKYTSFESKLFTIFLATKLQLLAGHSFTLQYSALSVSESSENFHANQFICT